MRVAFANTKATHIFFSKNISVYAIFNDRSLNDTLTNDIVSFEQLGPANWKQLRLNGKWLSAWADDQKQCILNGQRLSAWLWHYCDVVNMT